MIRNYQIALTFPNANARIQTKTLPCQPFASHSAILSIAGFLVQQLNQLQPPGRCSVMENEHSKSPIEQVHVDNLQLLPNFGLWCTYLSNCIFSQHAVVVGNTFHVEVPLPELTSPLTQEQLSLFTEKASPLESQTHEERLAYLFDLTEVPRIKRKMGIFCYTSPQNADYKYTNSAYFLGQLYNNEEWHFLDITDQTQGSIPTVQQLSTYDLILLPGSENSVYDGNPRVKEAAKRLFQAYHASASMKILGVCYGHQLVAMNFKVEVQKKNSCRDIEKVGISSKLLQEFAFLQPIGKAGLTHLHISQNHSDHVLSMPQGFHLLGESESCQIEGLISQNGRIFTMQFHPEFYCNNYLRSKEEKGENEQLRDLHYRDSMIVRECMSLFMR